MLKIAANNHQTSSCEAQALLGPDKLSLRLGKDPSKHQILICLALDKAEAMLNL